MLTSLREMLRSKLAMVLIGLLILSLAVWGVSDIFSFGGNASVVKTGPRELSQEAFSERLQDVVRDQQRAGNRDFSAANLNPETIDRLLNIEVTRLAELGYGEQIGARASDKAVADTIRSEESFADPLTGRFSQQQYERAVGRRDGGETGYEAEVRDALTRSYMRDAYSAGLVIPDVLVSPAFLRENRRVLLRYLDIPPAFFSVSEEITEAERVAFNEANPKNIPERRRIAVLSITRQDFEPKVEISDAELEAVYEAQRATRFEVPDTARFSRLSYADAETARRAFARLSTGTALDALDETLSPIEETQASLQFDDPAARADLEVFVAVFQRGNETGEYLSVVETENGADILRLDEATQRFLALDEVRETLLEELRSERADPLFEQALEIIDRRIGSGTNLAAIAEELELPLTSWMPMTATGAIASDGYASPQFADAASRARANANAELNALQGGIQDFNQLRNAITQSTSLRELDQIGAYQRSLQQAQELLEGEVSAPVRTTQPLIVPLTDPSTGEPSPLPVDFDRVSFVEVVEILPPYTAPFEEVRDTLDAQIMAERRSEAATRFADTLQAQLRSGELTLDSEAERVGGLVVEPAEPVTRAGDTELDPQVLDVAFAATEPGQIEVVGNAFGGITAVEIIDILPPADDPPMAVPALKSTVRDELEIDMTQAALETVLRTLDPQVNQRAYNSVVSTLRDRR